MSTVSLIGVTSPRIDGVNSAEELVAYAARVSNPGNQMNSETAPKLLKYLMKNKHWSPFEMVSVVLEIVTTRDIAHQIIRHRSFSFQEFSQRYASVESMGFTTSEARLQDSKNRQNSIELEEEDIATANNWYEWQEEIIDLARANYFKALDSGIAKEVARKLLPEGLTNTRVYMAGTLRSWIHYCQERTKAGTQKEHRVIAEAATVVLSKEFPSITGLLNDIE